MKKSDIRKGNMVVPTTATIQKVDSLLSIDREALLLRIESLEKSHQCLEESFSDKLLKLSKSVNLIIKK
jgi:hypothetical protein